jgi:hypothetical protein
VRSELLEESCIKRNKNLNSKVKIKIFKEKENKKLNLTICRASRSNVRFTSFLRRLANRKGKR